MRRRAPRLLAHACANSRRKCKGGYSASKLSSGARAGGRELPCTRAAAEALGAAGALAPAAPGQAVCRDRDGVCVAEASEAVWECPPMELQVDLRDVLMDPARRAVQRRKRKVESEGGGHTRQLDCAAGRAKPSGGWEPVLALEGGATTRCQAASPALAWPLPTSHPQHAPRGTNWASNRSLQCRLEDAACHDEWHTAPNVSVSAGPSKSTSDRNASAHRAGRGVALRRGRPRKTHATAAFDVDALWRALPHTQSCAVLPATCLEGCAALQQRRLAHLLGWLPPWGSLLAPPSGTGGVWQILPWRAPLHAGVEHAAWAGRPATGRRKLRFAKSKQPSGAVPRSEPAKAAEAGLNTRENGRGSNHKGRKNVKNHFFRLGAP